MTVYTVADFNRLSERGHRTSSGCLEWTGCLQSEGYGMARVAGSNAYVHRVAWSAFSGREQPKGWHVDHICRNRRCFEPTHLRLVTHAENIRLGYAAKPRASLTSDEVNRRKRQPCTQCGGEKEPKLRFRCLTCQQSNCIHGHPASELTLTKRGDIGCLACGRERARQSRLCDESPGTPTVSIVRSES